MKKIILAGIVILIAVFAVTCDEGLSDDDAIVEYTDVVVSKDGSQVTIYLDGVTVPVTKAQRAMTLGLAMMSYDYLEVVFRNSTGYSRSAWELGQSAGISGSGLRTGDNYGSATTPFGTPGACLVAGKKDGKTLFGVGKITATADSTSGTVGVIDATTSSVTFGLVAIQTGLLIGSEVANAAFYNSATGKKVAVDSFDFDTNTPAWTRVGHSSRQTLLDKVAYPTYQLPVPSGTTDVTTNATYTFKFLTGINIANPTLTDVTSTYTPAVLHVLPTATVKPLVQKRTPRFMDGGRYLQPSGHVDTKTKVAFGTTYGTAVTTDTVAFRNEVDLVFTTVPGNSGIFSFYLEIPVINLDARNATGATNLNSGKGPITWYIRTGLDSDLYSLDDGESSGGCVFMSTGISNSDWLAINWNWVD